VAYAVGVIGSVGIAVARATGTEFVKPTEHEIDVLREPLRLFLWKRAGFASAWGDIIGLVAAGGMIGLGRMQMAQMQMEQKRRQHAPPRRPQATERPVDVAAE
jgi:hypothetical protein